jgi:ABC-type transporter Mla maintaining outer membrane lipid asymmetry permease subunit MlaE
MTAIMVAGRSGSAFAAQIGTMKLTEEIDAMRTIGVSPIEAIVLPRVDRVDGADHAAARFLRHASCAIAGGGAFLCWIGLDIPPAHLCPAACSEVVPITDFYIMLIKAPVFGLIHRRCRLLPGHAGARQCRGGGRAHHRCGGAGDLHGHRARRVLCGLLYRSGLG